MKIGNRTQAFQRYLQMVGIILGFFVFIIMFVRFFVVSPGRINGPSMEPNFIDEDLFFVNRFTFLFGEPERYDVVQLINSVEDEADNSVVNGKLIIKRIIALPGKRVIIKRGKVFIVDKQGIEIQLDESGYLDKKNYTRVNGAIGSMEYQMKEFEYFVLGDNRSHSVDSRYYGPVHRSKIVGKVIFD